MRVSFTGIAFFLLSSFVKKPGSIQRALQAAIGSMPRGVLQKTPAVFALLLFYPVVKSLHLPAGYREFRI